MVPLTRRVSHHPQNKELDQLLRKGAYSLLAAEEDDEAARVFCEADIEDLLKVRHLAVALSRRAPCVVLCVPAFQLAFPPHCV